MSEVEECPSMGAASLERYELKRGKGGEILSLVPRAVSDAAVLAETVTTEGTVPAAAWSGCPRKWEAPQGEKGEVVVRSITPKFRVYGRINCKRLTCGYHSSQCRLTAHR